MDDPGTVKVDVARRWIALIVAILGLTGILLLLSLLWANRFDPVLTRLVLDNVPAIIGLPFAYIASFIVVALFRQSENPIEFEGVGFKFKGAAGEIILWAGCFLVVVGAIHVLWKARP